MQCLQESPMSVHALLADSDMQSPPRPAVKPKPKLKPKPSGAAWRGAAQLYVSWLIHFIMHSFILLLPARFELYCTKLKLRIRSYAFLTLGLKNRQLRLPLRRAEQTLATKVMQETKYMRPSRSNRQLIPACPARIVHISHNSSQPTPAWPDRM